MCVFISLNLRLFKFNFRIDIFLHEKITGNDNFILSSKTIFPDSKRLIIYSLIMLLFK